MTDDIKHECGVAFIRLLKPLDYYLEKYGTASYGLQKLSMLMLKQKNRGQNGAGVASIKLDIPQGHQYIHRYRTASKNYLSDTINTVGSYYKQLTSEQKKDVDYLKMNVPFMGELLLGHLRYGTYSSNTDEQCHPFFRRNNWMSRNLVLAGNFNITNVDALFNQLVDLGQHPNEKADTILMLEKIGHFLDDEVHQIYETARGNKSPREISELITDNLNIVQMLKRSFRAIDGGFVMVGMIGHGDAFILRDPAGIRPAFHYQDDEVCVVASERSAIQTVFNAPFEEIDEIKPGNALIVRKNGKITEEEILTPTKKLSCSFERIYFSKGNDKEIYEERKRLGYLVAEEVLHKVNYNFSDTLFSYIPNTAATSFYGMMDGVTDYLNWFKKQQIMANPDLTEKELTELISMKARRDKVVHKDEKLRTFITDDDNREDLIGQVYDITYGVVKPQDTLVVVDDSIVRGNTLKMSILRILDRLGPKKIIIVSSAPQIRYPDCYGIDMSKLKDFVAFKAMLALLEENNLEHKLDEVYDKAVAELEKPAEEMVNVVKELYALFDYEQITRKIVEIVTPDNIKADVDIIFQSIDGLHKACPDHLGDWYFTGDYPTPGGTRVANKSFVNFYKGSHERAY
ncbi:MAG: amidophosphoribosyltransferase [Bacteroidetes bacterium]|nr:MAG: amidophosphoribosyltransferase [Bacteroidota bacterium]